MTHLPTVSLNNDWRYCNIHNSDQVMLELDEPKWDRLPSLSDWRHHLLPHSGTVYLRRTFELVPTEMCVRYLFHLSRAPENTVVYMNGWQAGTTNKARPFRVNVTDQVTLEDNVSVLKVCKSGEFGAAWLQPIPCDEP
jgi:hypothetical protein